MSSSSPRRANRRSSRNPSAQSSPAAPRPGQQVGQPDDEQADVAGDTLPASMRSALADSPVILPSSGSAPHRGGPSRSNLGSPLKQMSNSQDAGAAGLNGLPSSPLGPLDRNQDEEGDPSSPLQYHGSSSPGRHLPSEFRSESSGLYIGSNDERRAARSRRGDINSDPTMRTPRPRRSVVVDGAGRVMDPPDGILSDVPSSDAQATAPNAELLVGTGDGLIWGTTISLEDSFRSFKDFLRNFSLKYRYYRDGLSDEQLQEKADAESKPYWQAMENMLLLGTTRLYLDIRDLHMYPPTRKLWHQIQAYPQEIVPIMDQSVHDLMIGLASSEAQRLSATQSTASRVLAAHHTGTSTQSSDPVFGSVFLGSDRPEVPTGQRPQRTAENQVSLEDQVTNSVYIVRPFGLDQTINLRDLNPSDTDKLICIKGLVIRATPVIPDMKEAFFKCNVCNHAVSVPLDRGRIGEPTECPRQVCSSKNSMQIIHNRCIFEDKQVIKLQETPDAVPPGQTPHSVSVCVYNELVDFCKAGDRVQLTGIFRVSPVRVNPRQRTVKSVYKTYVDVLYVQKVDKKRMGADPSTLVLDGDNQDQAEPNENQIAETRSVTPEEEARIRQTGQRADIYELLARSLAPSIYEMDDVKKGILLQLFSGTNKTFHKGGSPKYRGDINVLLCGDPSTSKSQLLTYVHKIAPRGVYTSGKGSSAVGLTAYVSRDPETRQLVLESGALVLSDGGVCCIDEFDKMSDSTRSVLHEVMEQQTVSVAKAGIITTLNARTSILASANPIGSRYNPNLPVPQNIDLPPTLLSRFDLVYLILDRVDERTDRRLARHLLSLYLEDSPHSAPANNDHLPVEFLTSYISYARAHIHPVISPEAGRELVKAYLDMRRLGQDVRAAEKRITATPRQLESMIRLSEAHAKMRLSDTVVRADVVEAARLINSALKTAATDGQGRIDMSLLTDGASAADRRRRADLATAVLRLLDDLTAADGQPVRWADAARRLADAVGIPTDPAEFAEALRALEAENKVVVSGEGARRSIRRVTAVG